MSLALGVRGGHSKMSLPVKHLRILSRFVAVAVVVSLIGLLAWKLFQGGSQLTASLERGETPTAPVFSLERLNAQPGELSLASYRGNIVVLNFWATWCGPCRDEMPLLQESWERLRGEGVIFVGINAESLRDDARAFLRRYGVTYPNVYDGKGWTLGRYGLTGYPETYFIDTRGRVRFRIGGAVRSAEELEDGIKLARRPLTMRDAAPNSP
jgi:cytochrome c biogenesis protein CcmG, thiol:disulfide interchange protein DsbE